jgi:histone H3/H4
MGELLVVSSKVKEAITKSVSGDFAEALDKKVRALIADAERRAGDNGRATVMAKDL